MKYDCKASIAHAQMLGRIGILSKAEVTALVKALNGIIALDREGKFAITRDQGGLPYRYREPSYEKTGEAWEEDPHRTVQERSV